MAARISFYILSLVVLAGTGLTSARPAGAAVFFFDVVAGHDRSVRLTVLTRGAIVAQGGRRVTLCIDRKVVAEILTGGDGYGYLTYTPREKGRWEVEVRSDGETGSGTLLVVDASDQALLVDLESCLAKTIWTSRTTAGMKRSLTRLREHFKIIYIAQFSGVRLARKLIAGFGLPEAVVLAWDGAQTLDELKQTGLNLQALIAAPERLTEAARFVSHRYAFEETEDGEFVADWDELVKRLRP